MYIELWSYSPGTSWAVSNPCGTQIITVASAGGDHRRLTVAMTSLVEHFRKNMYFSDELFLEKFLWLKLLEF